MAKSIRDTVLKVSLAGLFHDIGKFAQGVLELPRPNYRERNAGLYQPYNQAQKRHTHEHALYTAAFIEKFAKLLPEELNSPGWGEGELEDSFINLAAKHHNPETPLQWIITQADRLSSGFDRAEFEKGEEIGVRKYRQTRLLPIFERLLREDKEFSRPEDFLWRYPLKALSARSIFPVKAAEISQTQAETEYQELFDGFCAELEKLCHRKHIALWAQHFDSLLRIYTSQIPAARVGKVVHDVSLYDHLRSTAALAGALYLYHRLGDTLNEKAIRDDTLPKFLLVSGDFYGIQSFIFQGGGEERHHRAKLLRGRSFLVSLMMELAAELLCEKLGLSFLSVFFSAAGKFHLLAPNVDKAREAVSEAQQEINHWLYENFFGQCAIGFAITQASAQDFVGEKFWRLWETHLKNLEEAKFERFDLSRYGGAYNEHVSPGFLDRFRNDLPERLCPLCGRRPSAEETLRDKAIARKGEEERACSCKLCRDQAWLGKNLVKGLRLAVLKNSAGKLLEPIFGKYQLDFVNGCAGELADQEVLIRLFELKVDQEGQIPSGATFLPINGYVPVYTDEDNEDDRLLAGEKSDRKKEELIDAIKEGLPKTFHHLAQKALFLKIEENRKVCYGLPALGVFKADVDNLGAIFSCGLPQGLFTLSRLSTMSRQLNNFFTVYLPYALENEEAGAFRNIYTVFAGGDDLFLIGPWTEVRKLAPFLYQKFKSYVCENPKLHFSAGITLHKPHVPVDLIAHESEEALKQAKSVEGKNSLCMFGEVASWVEFEDFFKVEEQLKSWLEKECLSRRGLYRLNELAAFAAEEERLLALGPVPVQRLACVKWRAFLRYFLVRHMERAKKCPEAYEDIVIKLSDWLARYRGRFILALWPLLYNTRKQRI